MRTQLSCVSCGGGAVLQGGRCRDCTAAWRRQQIGNGNLVPENTSMRNPIFRGTTEREPAPATSPAETDSAAVRILVGAAVWFGFWALLGAGAAFATWIYRLITGL